MKRALLGFIALVTMSSSLFATDGDVTKKTSPQKKEKKSWTEYIKPSIDFRYRHEIIDEAGKNTRQRERIRIRAGVVVTPVKDLHIGFRLASGNDDPTSTNQTIGEAFSSKPVRIDLAYLSWDPTFFNTFSIDIRAGKFKNNFFRTGKNSLIWDGDLNLEGFALNSSLKKGVFRGFLNLGVDWIEERKSDASSFIIGAQIGVGLKSKKWHVTIGSSIFALTAIEGNETFVDNSKSYGNSTIVDADGVNTYEYGYQEVEGFLEAGFKASIFSFTLIGDFVANVAPGVTERYGYLGGAKVSAKIAKIQKLTFGYDYRYIEKDAVLGAFNDSDFIGGTTNGRGHRFSLAYKISVVKLAATYFYNHKNLADESDYHRVQLDIGLKY